VSLLQLWQGVGLESLALKSESEWGGSRDKG
jgi:hypothetical protein